MFYAIGFCSFIAALSTIGSLYLPDSVETNEYSVDPDLSDLENQSFLQVLKKKLKVIYENLKEPLNKKFYFFLIAQGLIIPSFGDFEYFFTIDILEISKFDLNISTISAAFMIVLIPIIY